MLIVALILLAIGLTMLETSRRMSMENPMIETPNGETSPEMEAVVFTGTVTEIDPGCYADGICKILIDGTIWVEFGRGWYQGPAGSFIGFDDIAVTQDKQVEISAWPDTREGIDYTILGDSSLYIKLL